MPRAPLTFRMLGATLVWTAAMHTWAAEEDSGAAPAQFSAEAGIGVEYDSNVSVEEVDRNSNQGDYALTMDLGLEAQKDLSSKLEVAVTYDFSQSLYKDFSQVDRQTHILGTDL